MRSEEELREFFRREIEPQLRRMAEEREALRRRVLGTPTKLLALLGLCAALVFRESGWLVLPLVFVFARALPALPTLVRLRQRFKQDVVQPTLEFWHPGLEYRPAGCMPPQTVRESHLFDGETFHTIGGEDFVAGRIGDTAFCFSELRLVERKSKKESRSVFSGLFFAADFHKSFQGKTVLLPDRAERLLGSVGRAFQGLARVGGGERIELEAPAFERHFVVYATDPVEARYLLSPALMQRIVQFRERTGAALRVAFVKGSLYLAMPLPGNLFEPVWAAGGVSQEALRTWIAELAFATGIVEELDLNTRIWSKGPSAAGPLAQAAGGHAGGGLAAVRPRASSASHSP